MIKKYNLKNGLTVIEEKRNSDTVSIQLSVKTGSNSETKGNRGISHLIEHMLFEGTTNLANAKEITNQIEKLGGEFNAYTNSIRTCFYIKVPTIHLEKAFTILADIIQNPLFRKQDIDKERQVILKEINIFNDESRYYQWILFQTLLYGDHPFGYPSYGTVEDVKKISREDIQSYFNRFYTANNTILSVVGKFSGTRDLASRYFSELRAGTENKLALDDKSVLLAPITKKVKRKISNSYLVMGYKTVPRVHPDSYVLDVIQAILGRGQSGKIFDEIRNKRGLAYEVGVLSEPSKDTGFFAVYLSADKKNIDLITKLIMTEFERLQEISQNELDEATGYIEGKTIIESEDTHNKADELAFWELMRDVKLIDNYLKTIKKVSIDDVRRISRIYLNKNYALAIVEQA